MPRMVPAGTGGDIDVFPSNDTDLVIDVNGYFRRAGRPERAFIVSDGALPRARHSPSWQRAAFVGELTVDVVDSVCAPPGTAQAYVFNADGGAFGSVGLPDAVAGRDAQPLVATLNALDGAVTSNMAIVPTNNGSIDAYASNLTQLILDISSYFAPPMSGTKLSPVKTQAFRRSQRAVRSITKH